MRHVVVGRAALGLALLLAAASVVFVWAVRDGQAAPETDGDAAAAPEGIATGETLYGRHCAACHRQAGEFADSLRAAADPATAALQMVAFLADHGRASQEEDSAIVAYLLHSWRRR